MSVLSKDAYILSTKSIEQMVPLNGEDIPHQMVPPQRSPSEVVLDPFTRSGRSECGTPSNIETRHNMNQPLANCHYPSIHYLILMKSRCDLLSGVCEYNCSIGASVADLRSNVDHNTQELVGLSSVNADIAELRSDVDTMGTNMDTMQSNVETVQSDVDTMRSDIAELRSDVDTMGTNMDTVQSDVETIQSDVVTMRSDIVELRADVDSMATDFNLSLAAIAKLRSDVDMILEAEWNMKVVPSFESEQTQESVPMMFVVNAAVNAVLVVCVLALCFQLQTNSKYKKVVSYDSESTQNEQ